MTEYKVQKIVKPKIEDRINELLSEDMQEAALKFTSWIRQNKMTPAWASTDSWKVNYRGKGLVYIRVYKETWTVNPVFWNIDEISDYIINGDMQNFIWENLYHCRFCHHTSCLITNKTYFGKEFKGLCGGRPVLHCEKPDERTLEFLKGLIFEMRMKISG